MSNQVEALRELVNMALIEQWDIDAGDPVDGNFETPVLDQLVSLLRTTDALEVLGLAMKEYVD